MDIPASDAAVHSTSPPPAYSEINEFPLFEGLPATSPLYTPAIAPPPYRETDRVQGFPQNTNRTRANPYPVLNVPTRITMVNHSQQVLMQQTVRTVAPQVIVVQPQQRVVVLGDTPTVTVCQYCHKNILTNVEYKPGGAAWSMCCLLTLLGLICGFCLIPFFVRGFQDAHHTCPCCRKHLGIYIRK
ncbi:lipopolysaccharide-induced tumor necrosis factor-alpha factor homolog [Myxocyprinus asiaticus]|uniref:lipopolysaccharide-induced tumor necrosis factor-alpha factor homolog n=1 Tax=Myxocyprinus asiaticus TaxID=70543 RepID=UPI0022238EB6|nr:lipopolysaccharide-induced tumor necrosis factor-alpha factor homolog [Myxocyprinus asiaticus]XP_051559811.1 lipopolysaccharide-induced tumor necrosis factor-alpha factor homolog [Myxocyprinus asiaticus]